MQELKFNIIKVEFPAKFEDIRKLLKKIFDKNVSELKNRHLIFGPANKTTLLEAQNKIMHQIAGHSKNFNLFHGASACAQAIKISHALELLETQTIYSLSNYINYLFEQAKQNRSKAVKKLISYPEFTQTNNLINEIIKEKIEHPKLIELKSLIEDKIKENPKAKIIVFSQYRDSVAKICKEIKSLDNTSAEIFIGQAKKTNGKNQAGLSQKEQYRTIKEFSEGKFNVLCATSIGEEGLDIPEVNSVIFYEPIPSAIRTIQRRGRTARLMPGELIMLVTKNTRDESYYWSAFHKEKRMQNAIKSIKDDLINKTELKSEEIEKEQKTLI